MSTIVLVIVDFRAMFPSFSDPTRYPDQMIELWFNVATDYLSPTPTAHWPEKQLTTALYLMTAHLLSLAGEANAGDGLAGGVDTSASIDGVSVSSTLPPFGNSGWKFWMMRTLFGQQLYAMLSRAAIGGFYAGASADRANFRKADGRF